MSIDLKEYKVLVTGALGVIGRRLTKRLQEAGAMVIGLDVSGASEVLEKDCLINGNMMDLKVVDRALRQLSQIPRPKAAVFHLAGMSDANQCEIDPTAAVEQNVVLTTNLLEACVKNKIRRIIYPSTAYVYGTSYDQPIEEGFALNPEGVYPLTKVLAEEAIKGYARFADLSCDIFRISNIYGPDSKKNTIFGTMLDQAKFKNSVFLHNLQPVRDFIFIEDVIETFARSLLYGEEKGCAIFNLSTGNGTSVGELARTFCRLKDWPPEAVKCDNEAGKKSVLVLSNQRLYQRLRWKPSIDIVEGIRKTLLQSGDIKYAQT